MEQTIGLNVIIWSKDRPIQLNLCLESLVANFAEAKESTINVVYRATSEKITKAYDKLRNTWANKEREGFPKVNFLYDTNFYLMTSMAFGYHPQTMFVVDDQVFLRKFSTKDDVFKLHRSSSEKYFSVSLRLDPTKDYCYPVDQKQPIPDFVIKNDTVLAWIWGKAKFDWGYVASLDGNIYHTNPIRTLFMKFPPLQVQNPNNLEMLLNTVSQQGAVQYPPQLLAYPEAKTVSVPANKVQTVYENRYDTKHTVEDLLEKWIEGYKIDLDDATDKLINSNSPHTPIEYTFIAQ